MTGASSPRGERAGTPGSDRDIELARIAELVVDSDDGDSPFGWREDPRDSA